MTAWALPVNGGYVTSRFGNRPSPGGVGSTTHRGVDLGGRGTDWLVRSVGPGSVLATGYNAVRGWWVAVRHDDGTTTAYQHLDNVQTAQGRRVAGGTVLGRMGQTGTSTATHLHLEAFPAGRFVLVSTAWASTDRAVDPQPYLLARGVDLARGTVEVSNPGGGGTGGSLPDVKPTTPPSPITPLEDDDMHKILVQIDPQVDGRWTLIDFVAGTHHPLANGLQLDIVKETPGVRVIYGPQPASIVAGLKVVPA